MAIKFGKVENIEHTQDGHYPASIQMGIENAPAKLIVKYITDMYENPLESAIRETISNALDAMGTGSTHDANDLSIWFERISDQDGRHWLHVMDNGCGMGRDTLMSAFTQYGVSDKRDRADATGAFGLGAKSPLAFATEMQIITKTEDEGCLFASAYRTEDDEFIADIPRTFDSLPLASDLGVEIEAAKGARAVTYEKTESGRIIPPAPASDEGASGNAASQDAAPQDTASQTPASQGSKPQSPARRKTVTYTVTDAIEGNHGTIVRFPISAKPEHSMSSYMRDTSEEPLCDYDRAETVLKATTFLLYATGERDDAFEQLAKPEDQMVKVGDLTISDDAGREVSARVFFSRCLAGSSYSTSLSGVFSDLLRCREKGKEPILDAKEVAFKVGNWIYPANMSHWRCNEIKGDPTHSYSSFPVVIDVPSSALAFLPSRDRLAETADSKDTIEALLAAASRVVEEFAADPKKMAEVVNWATRASHVTEFPYVLHDIVGYGAGLSYDIERKLVYAGSVPFDIESIDMWTGRDALSLYETPRIVAGLLSWSPHTQRYTNKGIYASPASFEGMLFAKRCQMPLSAFEHDSDFLPIYQEKTAPSSGTMMCAGWGMAKSVTAADKAVSILSDDEIKACAPSSFGEWPAAFGSEEAAMRRLRFDGQAHAKAFPCEYKGKPDAFCCAQGSFAPVPIFPFGIAALHIAREAFRPELPNLVVIDGSRKGVRAIRSAICNIAQELSLPGLSTCSTTEVTYIIIPPKTRDARDNWTEEEIEGIFEDIKCIYSKRCAITTVSSDMAEALSVPRKSVEETRDENEIIKMLKRSDTFMIRRTYQQARSDGEARGDVRGNARDEAPRLTRASLSRVYELSDNAEQLFKHISENPGESVVIVADERRMSFTPFEAAKKYAELALALEYIDDSVGHVICLSSRNFNVRRAEALMSMGILTIYDEANKSEGRALMPAGCMGFERDEKEFEISEWKRAEKALRRKGTSDGQSVPIDEIEKQIGPDPSTWEKDYPFSPADDKNKLVYKGPETEQLKAFKDKTRDGELQAYHRRMALSHLPYSLSSITGADQMPFSSDWVEILSFGHERVSREECEIDVDSWREKAFDQVKLDGHYHPSDADKDQMRRLAMIYSLWEKRMKDHGICISASSISADNIRRFSEIGKAIGIKEILDAWYLHGVPLPDLLLGEGIADDVVGAASMAMETYERPGHEPEAEDAASATEVTEAVTGTAEAAEMAES